MDDTGVERFHTQSPALTSGLKYADFLLRWIDPAMAHSDPAAS